MNEIWGKYFFLFFLGRIVFCPCIGKAQIVGDTLPNDWDKSGYERTFAEPLIKLNIKDFGALGNGIQDESESIYAAIDVLGGRYGEIFFPEGEYKIQRTLQLPDSCVLIGEGAAKSLLVFDLGNRNEHCIQAEALQQTSFFPITQNISRGDKRIIIDSSHQLKIGDEVELTQDNGNWDAVPIDWAKDCVGHLTTIERIDGDTLWLADVIRIDMDATLNLRIRKIAMRKHIGISCLGIRRKDAAEFGYQIHFKYVKGGWISGIESGPSVGSHVLLDASREVNICSNYFHDAFAYDGMSTHGYGVTLIQHTNLVRVENNIFKHLRHAMMVKQGANGNVFGYNYVTDTYRTEEPHGLSGDISLHGHYAYANLFEGNVVNNIIVDHFWGPSGPFNLFFRNRAIDYGVISFNFNENSPPSDHQWFIGNEVIPSQLPKGQLVVGGSDNFLYANHVLGRIDPPNSSNLSDSSWYLNQTPNFWAEKLPWPSIGVPNEINWFSIPAQYRYQQLVEWAICDCDQPANNLEIPEENTTYTLPPENEQPLLIFANLKGQTLKTIFSSSRSEDVIVTLQNINGQVLLHRRLQTQAGKQTFSIFLNRFLAAGIYVLRIQAGKKQTYRKLLLYH